MLLEIFAPIIKVKIKNIYQMINGIIKSINNFVYWEKTYVKIINFLFFKDLINNFKKIIIYNWID